jgi:hypothetical protein
VKDLRREMSDLKEALARFSIAEPPIGEIAGELQPALQRNHRRRQPVLE